MAAQAPMVDPGAAAAGSRGADPDGKQWPCCLQCMHPYGAVPGEAHWALGLDVLAFKAGLLDCTLQFPQGSCFSH